VQRSATDKGNKTMSLRRALLLFLAILTGIIAGPAHAETPEDFYKKTRMTIVVGSEEGGSLSLYARLVAKHISQYIPGHPNIIVQNIPGASGLVAANAFANRLPRDGSTILLPHKDTVLAQMLEADRAKFDTRTFGWIGRMVDYPAVLIVKTTAGVRTFDDLKTRPIHIGASGRTSQGNLAVYLMNHFLGTKFISVLGYRGGPDLYLAMERGETEARLVPMDSLAFQRPDWIKANYITIIAQESLVPVTDSKLPLIVDMIADPRGKQMFKIVDSGSMMGFGLAAPPGVPADRLAVLRAAFNKTMADPVFLAAAKQAKSPINADTGESLARFVNDVVGTPADVIAELKRIAKMD
jgi:tripartite-type tricarboxylate transporter receptor subunit TctC